MIALEAHFLDTILQLAVMQQPVTPSIAIEMINYMVASNKLQEQIVEWKKKHLPETNKENSSDKDTSTTNPAHVGKKYWRNFIKRHPEIGSKKAVCFDSNREDWCTHANFEVMYNKVYSAMVRSGVALELPNEVWVTLDGRITENEDESTGKKTRYLLTHPELVFFVDEVGSNTSQKNDGNVGGQKFVVDQNKRALLRLSFHHARIHERPR